MEQKSRAKRAGVVHAGRKNRPSAAPDSPCGGVRFPI